MHVCVYGMCVPWGVGLLLVGGFIGATCSINMPPPPSPSTCHASLSG